MKEMPEIPLEEGYDVSKDPALAHDDDDTDSDKETNEE